MQCKEQPDLMGSEGAAVTQPAPDSEIPVAPEAPVEPAGGSEVPVIPAE